MGNRNKSKPRAKTVKDTNGRMVGLATDILDGKVFTSRHIWVMCEGDETKYINLMKCVFCADSVANKLLELKDLYVRDIFDGVIFYQYIDKSQIPFDSNNVDGSLPMFKEIEFIYGDDVKSLDNHLKSMYKERLN